MVLKRPVTIWKNYYCQITRSFKANFLLRVPPHAPPPPSPCIIEIVNKMVIDFVWSHKNPKLGKTLLLDQRKRGVGPA